jgi:hypothetical protein
MLLFMLMLMPINVDDGLLGEGDSFVDQEWKG